jgi:two-component system, NarL family, sensor histidine kinase UhpB
MAVMIPDAQSRERDMEDNRIALVPSASRHPDGGQIARALAAVRKVGSMAFLRLSDTFWRRRSVRAQLLITIVAMEAVAALVAGGVTILQARKSTRVEITASLRMAEVLVGETVDLLQQALAAEHFLANLPSQLRFVRHVRITVHDAAGQPMTVAPASDAPETRSDERAAAPAWFASLIAPPEQKREVPVLVKGQRLGSVLLTGEPGDEIAEVWENTVDYAILALLVSLAVVGALYILFGRVLDPITNLAGGLADLERRNYRVHLPRPRPLELAEITDRFNALAQALEVVRAENARLSHRLITAQDDERRRMASELHDEVGPSLFGLKANAASLATIADEFPDAAPRRLRERVRDLLAIIEHLQVLNRGLLNRLRPMALGHIPLGDILAEVVRDRARQHPQALFSFTPGRLLSSYGDSIDLTIYRCVQEGLTNAIRHAQGKKVEVGLGERIADAASRLELTVRDDGCGFDPGTPLGLGLQGMRERVQALGGIYVIEGAPGRGTCVRITIPIHTRSEETDTRDVAASSSQ